MPYHVEYTFNGRTERHGPYSRNQDYYISGLAPGLYENLTIIGANGCRNTHGNVTVDRAFCDNVCTPEVTIRNQGACPVEVFLFKPSISPFLYFSPFFSSKTMKL